MLSCNEIRPREMEPGPGMAVQSWYAVYTRPHHEKRVAKQLAERRVESFLPLSCEVHRWKDRRKQVYLPIFPGYVFLRINWEERLRILQLPGVVRFVSFDGTPALIPDAQLEPVRHAMESGSALNRHRYLQVGRRVRVCRGALQGTEGILVRSKGAHRLVLSIDLIQRSVAVEVDAIDVIPIARAGQSNASVIQTSAGSMQMAEVSCVVENSRTGGQR